MKIWDVTSKVLSSVLIYLYRSWCPICKPLHQALSLKNCFQTLLYDFQKILHHFRSTICHSHILIKKAVVLPLTFLEIHASPQVCIKPYALITLSKHIFQLPRCLHQSIDGSLELAHFVSTFRIDKTFWLHHIQIFF